MNKDIVVYNGDNEIVKSNQIKIHCKYVRHMNVQGNITKTGMGPSEKFCSYSDLITN